MKKVVKKKVVKKAVTIKKRAPKKVAAKKSAPAKSAATKAAANKPIGVVTHFFSAIKVAIIKCKQPMKVGMKVGIRGATTDFTQKIASMQYDHMPLTVSKKGQEVGIKVSKRVREGDEVFLD